MSNFLLKNGIEIPALGYGTWLIPDDIAAKCVINAVNAGYTHIDTAQAYGNEAGVGEGIRKCGKNRDELFVTTKVAAELKSYDAAKASIYESLEKLGLDYIDLVIIHCPQPWAEFRGEKRYFKENVEVWKALEEVYKEGKIRAIGVSNFLIDDLENILNNCEIKPMINQIHLHIGRTPNDLVEFCKKNNIVVESYSPIAHGEAVKSKNLQALAHKYNVSVAQACIKYTLQLGTVSLPKAVSIDHIVENTKLDFTISDKDMDFLKTVNGLSNDDELWPIF